MYMYANITISVITITILEIPFETLDTSTYAQYYIMWKAGISKRRQTTQAGWYCALLPQPTSPVTHQIIKITTGKEQNSLIMHSSHIALGSSNSLHLQRPLNFLFIYIIQKRKKSAVIGSDLFSTFPIKTRLCWFPRINPVLVSKSLSHLFSTLAPPSDSWRECTQILDQVYKIDS